MLFDLVSPHSAPSETNPEAERLIVTPLACALVGMQQRVLIAPGSRVATLYGAETAVEDYRCSYGVNPAYYLALAQAGLRLTGFGEDSELRIVELDSHPFFVATLFVPQMQSTPGGPHPLLAGFADAVKTAASKLE